MRRALLTAALMVGVVATSRGADEPPRFPIMAWDYADDEPTLRSMADCGINAVAFVPEKALDLCAKLGLRAIVFDPASTPQPWNEPFQSGPALKNLPALIERVNDHPAVMGYHLRDEPDASQFPALGEAVALVRKLAPGKWPYINMTPGMGEGYDQFLDLFVKQSDPTILSYDNYPLGQDGNFSYGYWANIAQVRAAGLRHKLPFHTIMLSVAHLTYGEPTATTLRLQAYGALAYGARGICYYKFISRELPILDAPDLGDWRAAPLDQFLEKTPNWDVMRDLNRQIANLGPWLLKLRSDVVYHVGEVPEGNRGLGDDSLLKGLLAGESLLIGEFTHEEDGSRWLMIVNKHLKHATTCQPDFREPPEKVEYVSPVTGELKPFPAPWYSLAPGQGVLLKITPKAK